MRVFWIQLHKELLELWHTRKLLIVAAVLVAFGLMSPILAKITPDLVESMGESENVQIMIGEPTEKDANTQFHHNITQFGLLLVVLLSFGAVAGEKDKGQATLMLAHPLPRETFVLAKFAALALTFGAGLILSAAADFLYTVLLFQAPDVGGFLALSGLIYVWLLALLAVTLLASTLGRSMAGAGGIAFLFVIVLLLASTFTNAAPGKITSWGHALANQAGGPDRWAALVVALALIGLALAASCVAIRRQEIG